MHYWLYWYQTILLRLKVMYLSVLAKRIFIIWYTMVSVLIYTHIIPNHVLLYLFFGSLCAELLHHLSLLAMLKNAKLDFNIYLHRLLHKNWTIFKQLCVHFYQCKVQNHLSKQLASTSSLMVKNHTYSLNSILVYAFCRQM